MGPDPNINQAYDFHNPGLIQYTALLNHQKELAAPKTN